MKRFLTIILLAISTPAIAQQIPQSAAQIQLSFAPLVKVAAPAVVNIYAKVVREERPSPFQGDPFFERFFEGFGAERPRVQNSLGSGVVLSSDGIVVSNYHVIENATDVRVVLADRREFEADILLGDSDSDLVIIKLKQAEDLPFLKLRASDTVEVGELTLAIGNPFGVGQTVSSGIVSGLARSGIARGKGPRYFIQTDAPINPGNSGGALIDMNAALIGINSAILTRSGGSNGIGFAIPADLVAAFVAQAKAGRTVFGSPWAGITAQPVDGEMAEAFGLDRPGGIVLSGLHPQSPFARAGLLVGDVIFEINDQPVNTASELMYRMNVSGLGERAIVTFVQNGDRRMVAIDLAEAADHPPRDERVLSHRQLLEGMRIARINPAVLSEHNLPLAASGVVVLNPSRIGRRVGLRRGDVIENINDNVIRHPNDVVAAFDSDAPGYSITVLRGERRVIVRFRV